MNQADILHLASEAMMLALKLSAPILLVSLAIGVFLSLIQSVTQVSEATLTFVPKLAGIALVFVFGGGWMLNELTAFTRHLFDIIPRLVNS